VAWILQPPLDDVHELNAHLLVQMAELRRKNKQLSTDRDYYRDRLRSKARGQA